MKQRWLGALWLLVLAACGETDPAGQARTAEAAGDWRGAAAAWRVSLESAQAGTEAARTRLALGKALVRLAEPEARGVLETALSEADTAGDRRTAAEARQQLARAAMWQGRTEEALAYVDRALAEPPETLGVALELELRLTRAGVLWRRGDLAAAEAIWATLADRARREGLTAVEMRASEGLAGALRFRGRFAQAAELCDRLEPWARTNPNPEERSRTLANCAGTRGSAGQGPAAVAVANEALAAAESVEAPRVRVHARNALAAQLLDAGRTSEALAAARAAEAEARAHGLDEYLDDALLYAALAEEKLGRPQDARLTLAALQAAPGAQAVNQAEAQAALARLSEGEPDRAITHFDAAVADIESMRGAVTKRQLHDFFDLDRRGPYLGLVSLLVARGGPGDFDRALATLGRLESRTFVESLREGERAGSAEVEAPRGLPAQGEGGDFDAVRLRAALPADVAVIEALPLADALILFWATRDTVRAVRVPVGAEPLVATARHLGVRLAGRQESGDQGAWLARQLLGPLAAELEAWPAGHMLCFIGHGGLRALPLEALPWGESDLGARWAVFGAPSLPALSLLLERAPPPAGTPALVVADAGGDLPGARAEAARLAERLANPTLLVGPEATERHVRAALGAAEPLHFGVHGYPPGPDHPPWLGLVAGDGHDGRLTPAEVSAARLPGSLVVLSACETSVGTPNATDELPDVLDRAFLHAGARAVVSTRWPIHDSVAMAFNEVFYEGLPKLGALRAFHAAQRRLAAGRGPVIADLGPARGFRRLGGAQAGPDTRRPAYWAAFAFTGNPR